MKNILLYFAFCISLSCIAQSNFVPDASGFVANAAFKKLITDRQYELVGAFVRVSQNPDVHYAKVYLYGKWGFIDTNGNEVIKPHYAFISDFKDGLAIAAFEEYITSRDGGYDDVGNSQRVIRHVFINLKGDAVSKPYTTINPYYKGLAVVGHWGTMGVIDRLGQEVVPLQYDQVYINERHVFARQQPGSKWGVLNHQGKVLTPFIYDNLRWFNGFLLAFTGADFCLLNPKTGKSLSKKKYTNTNVHDNNIDYDHWDFKPDVLAVCNDKGCFLVNHKGRRVSDVYTGGVLQASQHYYRVGNKGGSGLINDKGDEVIDLKYDYTGPYEDGSMFFAKKGEAITYFNHEGKALDLSAYDPVGNFSNSRGYVSVNNKYGFIDYSGRLVIPAVYDNPASGFESGRTATVRKDGKWGIINTQGETVVPFVYDELYRGNRCYYTTVNQKRGLLDDSGKELIAPQYQSLQYIPLGDGLLEAQVDGKWGIIDLQNKVLVPFEYDRIDLDYIESYMLLVKKGELSGIVNLEGKILLSVAYENLYGDVDFGSGIINIQKEYRDYLADFYGHEIFNNMDELYRQ